MLKSPRGAGLFAALLVAPLVAWGCGGNTNPPQSTSGTPATEPAPQEGPRGDATQAEGPRTGSGGRARLKPLMTKIGNERDPNSLVNLLKEELKADEPAWDKLQPQASEFAKLATEIGKADAPRGSKESWAKLTLAFADSAASLDKAAQAKDLTAFKAAHTKLTGSCTACHREHRGGGGGPGGGRGGFAAFPQPTQVMSPFMQDMLKLTPEQKQQMEDLQKEVDAELDKMLTDEQKKQLKDMKEGTGRGGFGGGGGGGFGPAAPPGGRGAPQAPPGGDN